RFVGAGRQVDEVAVAGEGPAVEGALEGEAIALVVTADHVAAMGTGVQEDVDLVVAAAGDDDLLLAHARADEIARVGDLADVADEEPAAGQDLFQLLLVDVRVAEDRRAAAAL